MLRARVMEEKVASLYRAGKIHGGVFRACEKRPVSIGALDSMIDEIETAIRKEGLKEIDSKDIGEMVMERLRAIDKVAYVRFASVYRNFEDVSSFEEEARSLKQAEREAQEEREEKCGAKGVSKNG
jgi:transcriptional repressor NrdR